MSRPTKLTIRADALRHNLSRVKACAPGKQVMAMVKANAYGCGLANVVTELDEHVDAFGVASLGEGIALRKLGSRSECVLLQGVFDAGELPLASSLGFQCVIHQPAQLEWILSTPLAKKTKIWVKVNTGMHRLGFQPSEVPEILSALKACSWVDDKIGLMSHLAFSDEPEHPGNLEQWHCFEKIELGGINVRRSMANSGAILSLPEMHADMVRPGIMLYGVSPYPEMTGQALGLMPVMSLTSEISAIHHLPVGARIGYGGTWRADKPSVIGIVPIGYGDGYPRHLAKNTPVGVGGEVAHVVGRVSMDMLSIDITHCPYLKLGTPVELWGHQIPIEKIAASAGTIAYELMCQMTYRVYTQEVI